MQGIPSVLGADTSTLEECVDVRFEALLLTAEDSRNKAQTCNGRACAQCCFLRGARLSSVLMHSHVKGTDKDWYLTSISIEENYI